MAAPKNIAETAKSPNTTTAFGSELDSSRPLYQLPEKKKLKDTGFVRKYNVVNADEAKQLYSIVVRLNQSIASRTAVTNTKNAINATMIEN